MSHCSYTSRNTTLWSLKIIGILLGISLDETKSGYERDEIRLRRMGKQFGNIYVSAEAKLAFVIRVPGINGVSPS
jgi:hypothetical protein